MEPNGQNRLRSTSSTEPFINKADSTGVVCSEQGLFPRRAWFMFVDDTEVSFGVNASSASLKRAQQSMDPVLTRLHDQVLYMKHNLKAAAIASLKGETLNIQIEISKLLKDMNAAISQADSFISTLQ